MPVNTLVDDNVLEHFHFNLRWDFFFNDYQPKFHFMKTPVLASLVLHLKLSQIYILWEKIISIAIKVKNVKQQLFSCSQKILWEHDVPDPADIFGHLGNEEGKKGGKLCALMWLESGLQPLENEEMKLKPQKLSQWKL